MTAPPTMTAEERERQTHAADHAVDSDALARFLSGPNVKGVALVEANTLEGSYDPKEIQRRRWGVGTAIEKKQPSTTDGAPGTPPAAAAPSWWQQTSWFAGGVPDVAPVLADPTGADGGTPSAGGLLPSMGGATCQNRFVGPGQAQPHDPQTAMSVRLNGNSACEDPGEIYGGYNAAARASGGGAYTPVGGAMVHSRLSIQPRVLDRHKGPRCADEFEKATPAGAAAQSAANGSCCAFASAAARPKYGFDFERGVWEVQGTGAAVLAAPPAREPRKEAAPLEEEEEEEKDGQADAMDTESDDDAMVVEAMSPEEVALMETTRDLRLSRFGATHDAALAAVAGKKAAVAAAARAARAARAAAARANKRAAASVPLTPERRAAPHRDGEYTYQHTASSPSASEEGAAAAPAPRSEDWQMLRLTSGDVVFFGAPDASPARVAAWIDGTQPWPEVRVMELSRRERCQLSVPHAAPGPLASGELAEAAREELRNIAAEDAAAEAKTEAEAAENSAAAAAGTNGQVRLPPGSTATPQQANIIEQLVNATGASKGALEAADAAGGEGAQAAAVKDKEVAALQDTLRGMIREKHEAVVAARAAEARVAALEAAMAAAGVAVPP
jgi:hypothetical protein